MQTGRVGPPEQRETTEILRRAELRPEEVDRRLAGAIRQTELAVEDLLAVLSAS